MLTEIETWGDVLKALQQLTPEQLNQTAQILPNNPDGDVATPLEHAYAFGTVEALVSKEANPGVRSANDNKHHPEEIILCVDGNPFGEDGSIAQDLMTGEKIFVKDTSRQFTLEQCEELVRQGFEPDDDNDFVNQKLNCRVFIDAGNLFVYQVPKKDKIKIQDVFDNFYDLMYHIKDRLCCHLRYGDNPSIFR